MKNKGISNTLLLVVVPLIGVIVIYSTLIGHHSDFNKLLSESFDGSYTEKRQKIMNLKLFLLILSVIGNVLLVLYRMRLSFLIIYSIICLFLLSEYFLDLVDAENGFAHNGNSGLAVIPLFLFMLIFQIMIGVLFHKRHKNDFSSIT